MTMYLIGPSSNTCRLKYEGWPLTSDYIELHLVALETQQERQIYAQMNAQMNTTKSEL